MAAGEREEEGEMEKYRERWSFGKQRQRLLRHRGEWRGGRGWVAVVGRGRVEGNDETLLHSVTFALSTASAQRSTATTQSQRWRHPEKRKHRGWGRMGEDGGTGGL